MDIRARVTSRIAIGAIALFTGLCPTLPAQISMQRPGLTGVPQGRKATAAPPTPTANFTPDEQKRFVDMVNRMPPKARKKLNKIVKHMTPEQRKQLVALLKKQMAQKAPASQGLRRR